MSSSTPASNVLAFPAPTPAQSCEFMAAKLSYHADAWDVAEDLRNGIDAIVVIDTRSPALYEAAHVPGAPPNHGSNCYPSSDCIRNNSTADRKTAGAKYIAAICE